MSKKKTNIKSKSNSKKKKIKEEVVIDADTDITNLPEPHVPSRVLNKEIYKKLIETERRVIRIEKLVLMLLDESFFKRDENARVQYVEKLVREGKFDELEELMKSNN